jgi:hypothetical protein
MSKCEEAYPVSQETLHEVFRQYRTAEDKYTYFLLAAAGAGIAFAVNRTSGSGILPSQIPLAAAVLSWAMSFFFGCRQVLYVKSNLFANFNLLQVESGEHPEIGHAQAHQQAAAEGIREAMKFNAKRAGGHATRQFTFLVLGAAMYVAWHVLDMSLR